MSTEGASAFSKGVKLSGERTDDFTLYYILYINAIQLSLIKAVCIHYKYQERLRQFLILMINQEHGLTFSLNYP